MEVTGSLKFVFFPGCMIPIRYPQIEVSIRRTLPRLGVEIVDEPGFTCCPDPIFFKASDKLAWLTVAARNLSLAEEAGLEILTACSGCTSTLKDANHMLKSDPDLRKEVNRRLERIGRSFKGTTEVHHVAVVLREHVGLDAVAASVSRPLEGVKVALHYGCHLLKPSEVMAIDNPDEPRILHDLVRALGAEVVDHDERFLCCGKGCMDGHLPESMTLEVLESAERTGADCMCMICPTCFSSFDTGQIVLARKKKRDPWIAPVYYLQLLGIAQGDSPEQMGLTSHRIKPDSMIERLRLGAPE